MPTRQATVSQPGGLRLLNSDRVCCRLQPLAKANASMLSIRTRTLAVKLAILPLAGVLFTVLASTGSQTAPQAVTTVEMKDMTWEDVRAVVAGGATTVIVPTGGIEQNGPHMVLAKHDYIVSHAAKRIAAELGRTVVAPVLSYVPEGDVEPATGNMRFPGTLGVSEAVFAGMLEGIATSLKSAGFKLICFIGDHGQSQPAQKAVAAKLSALWEKAGVRVVQVDAYYDDASQTQRLKALGETDKSIGFHAGLVDTAELLAVHPAGVDLARDKPRGFFKDTGASGQPSKATPELGRWLIEMRIKAAVQQIKPLMP